MANYHLEIKNISRGKSKSIANSLSYITGRELTDYYNGRIYIHQRKDVLYSEIFRPQSAPDDFGNLQSLCDQIDKVEKRRDARTARVIIASLPNELPLNELVKIVREYVNKNFISQGLCAVAAIHEGKNARDPTRNNPHVHVIVSTRTVGPDGFSKTKAREHDKSEYIWIWRKSWADVQNQAYERNGLEIQVSHESLKDRGIDREAAPHLTRVDWEKEQRGERTLAGDRRRNIECRNKDFMQQHRLKRERIREMELTR